MSGRSRSTHSRGPISGGDRSERPRPRRDLDPRGRPGTDPAGHLAIPRPRPGQPGCTGGIGARSSKRWIRAELDERKVLDPVVIDAQGEPLQARVGVAELREHDDLHPHGLGRPAEMLQDFQAVEDRHPDIQQQQGRRMRPDQAHRLAAVARLPHDVPLAPQAFGQQRPQVGLVLGQDDGRGDLPGALAE